MNFFLMTSHHDSHTKTDVKPELIPGIQTRNGISHDKYDVRGIAHACTNRKDNIFMQDDCTLTMHTRRLTYSVLSKH